MKRQLFAVALLIAAFVLYSIGLVSGALPLFAGGAVLELWFWSRILSRWNRPNHRSERTRGKPLAAEYQG